MIERQAGAAHQPYHLQSPTQNRKCWYPCVGRGGGRSDTNLFHDGALRLGVVQGLEKGSAVELEQGALTQAGRRRQPLLGEDAADDLCAGGVRDI